MVTDSERASRGAGVSRRGPRERKVQISQVPVIWLEPTHAEFCNVFKMMKSLARLFPGKMRMWRAHVWKAFVNLVRNARRLASPRQTYDDSDVVLVFAGHCTECKVFISMACIKFADVKS